MNVQLDVAIKPSHVLERLGYMGRKKCVLESTFSLERIRLGTAEVTEISLAPIKDELFRLKFSIPDDLQSARVFYFVELLAKVFSFQLNTRNLDPHYGTYTVNTSLFDLTMGRTAMRDILGAQIQDHIADTLGRMRDLKKDSLILDFLYEGLRAERVSAKFFSWFLILEYLESLDSYKSAFSNDALFSDDEIEVLTSLSDSYENDRKKGVLLGNCKRATVMNRQEKLHSFLAMSGIVSFTSMDGQVPLTVELIKNILDARHSLFHSGSGEVSDALLYGNLFPLVMEITERFCFA